MGDPRLKSSGHVRRLYIDNVRNRKVSKAAKRQSGAVEFLPDMLNGRYAHRIVVWKRTVGDEGLPNMHHLRAFFHACSAA